MAESAYAYLNSLIAKYTPPTTYFDAFTKHRNSIELRLDLWYGVHEMFETGSLRHGTGVKFYSDADYFVSLKGTRPTPTTALNNVKGALADRLPSTTVSIRRPAVVCRFANGLETVEVVPAYPANPGYWIPDPTNTSNWMRAHPKDHNAYVNRVNQKHSGGAKKLARLAKIWKYKRLTPVSSCYLEMRAAKHADGETTWAVATEILNYFTFLKNIELAAMNDPTGLSARFTACSSDATKREALSKLDTAITRARNARDFIINDKHSLAIEQYKLLFNQN